MKKKKIFYRREMMQMERDNELNVAQKQHLIHKLQEQAAELAQLDVESLVNESNQKRMSRAKQRIEYLSRFADIISETMTLSEMFWVLMHIFITFHFIHSIFFLFVIF